LPWPAYPALRSNLGAGGPPSFPPSVVVQVKALACELPHRLGLPLSRLSIADIQQEVVAQGLVAEISGTTLWRWLNADALRPWQHRSWIFPRDPDFAAKAGRVLDLYERRWEGVPLRPTDFVISADEKTSVQARRRKQPTLPGASGRPTRVEHEYFREGAWTYLAAWDVHRAKLFGRCENKSGIAPTDRLMAEVMTQEPYLSAHRVFWIMDNCSAHRGQKAAQRIRSQWPNAVLVHTPIHASWVNQIEIYFSIVQRKVLTPNDFLSLAQLEQRLLAFQKHYQQTASPFQWTFTRKDLNALLTKLSTKALATLPPETISQIRHRNSEPEYLATAENALLAFDPTRRMVPITRTKITANMTAYSAMSCPSSDPMMPSKSCMDDPFHLLKNH
jgi:hypothetical protein